MSQPGELVRGWWDGVLRCRARICPVCHVSRRMKLLHEVEYVANLNATRTRQAPMMATLTVRHRPNDPVEITRAVRACWRKMLQGRAWGEFQGMWGGLELIAAEEVTYGKNGWHPHMHVLLMPERKQRAIDLDEAQLVAAMLLADRWQEIVTRTMGAEYRPSSAHGTMLHQCSHKEGAAKYIAKIAYELTDPSGGKSLLHADAAQTLETRGLSSLDLLLTGKHAEYLQLCTARKRARDLTFSTGLRPLRDGFAELPKAELETVATIRGSEFERMKHQHGERAHIEADGEVTHSDILLDTVLARSRADVLAILARAGVEPMTADELAAERPTYAEAAE